METENLNKGNNNNVDNMNMQAQEKSKSIYGWSKSTTKVNLCHN